MAKDRDGQPLQQAQEQGQGQYGAVTGQGFGGGMAKDRDGQPLQQGQGQEQGESAYAGYGGNDS